MFLARAMRDMPSAKSKKVIDENVCPIVIVYNTRGAHSKKFVSKLVQLQFNINESI